MKKVALLVLLLVTVSVVGCQKKQTMSVTGPQGQTAGITINK